MSRLIIETSIIFVNTTQPKRADTTSHKLFLVENKVSICRCHYLLLASWHVTVTSFFGSRHLLRIMPSIILSCGSIKNGRCLLSFLRIFSAKRPRIFFVGFCFRVDWRYPVYISPIVFSSGIWKVTKSHIQSRHNIRETQINNERCPKDCSINRRWEWCFWN